MRKIKKYEYIESYIELKRLDSINRQHFCTLEGMHGCKAKFYSIDLIIQLFYEQESQKIKECHDRATDTK